MLKNANQGKKVIFGSLKIMVAAALLAAMSIVCGKYLKIPVGDIMRFSFENLPILLAGMAFGSVVGVITGVLADLVGCLMVGYAINPIVTLGAAAIGLFGGLVYKLCAKLPLIVRTLITVVSAHIVGSVLIKTFGLAKFYSIPFLELMLWRTLNYVIVAALEFVIIYFVMKNKAVNSAIDSLKR
jgi:ECF transporter S component (folate family)